MSMIYRWDIDDISMIYRWYTDDIYRWYIDDVSMIYRWYTDEYRWYIHDMYSKIGPGAITGHQIGRIKMISIPTKTTSKNLLFAAVKSWIWAVYDRFISKILTKTLKSKFRIFFWVFISIQGVKIAIQECLGPIPELKNIKKCKFSKFYKNYNFPPRHQKIIIIMFRRAIIIITAAGRQKDEF